MQVRQNELRLDGPDFNCKCCGLCCRRDPYYAVSLLDIHNISLGLGMTPREFFKEYCDVVPTPGGFRYPVILAPDGCPFLVNNLCGIHIVKPIACRVFPESSLLPVTELKKSINAIGTCEILNLPDDARPLRTDLLLLAARDIHFECTKEYFDEHEEFEEKSWREAADRLKRKLEDAGDLQMRAEGMAGAAISRGDSKRA